jgi:Xaa-Pro aminopeptidase
MPTAVAPRSRRPSRPARAARVALTAAGAVGGVLAADRLVFGPGAAAGPHDLDAFREVQQLAYRCAEEIAAGLEPGVTERETAARMKQWLLDNGVQDWFHVPFAWFGDRTAFKGFHLPHQFLPTNRRLEQGMPFVLDCAPVKGNGTADIGYSGAIGGNAVVDQLLVDLAAHRALILDLVRAGKTMTEVYEAVERLAGQQGLECRHRAYPGRVIAHRVEQLVPAHGRGRIGPFGTRHLVELGREVRRGTLRGRSPLWADHPFADHPPSPGLWAVEPHLALRGTGAKFEELLVVGEDDAFWLDDDLPHVRRARELTAAVGG